MFQLSDLFRNASLKPIAVPKRTDPALNSNQALAHSNVCTYIWTTSNFFIRQISGGKMPDIEILLLIQNSFTSEK